MTGPPQQLDSDAVRPFAQTRPIDSHRWLSLGEEPLLELLPSGADSQRWLYLHGKLHRPKGPWTARLRFLTAEAAIAEVVREMPVSCTCTINEVVEIPPGVFRILFEPMQSAGEFQFRPYALRRIGEVERIRRMVKRVVGVFYHYPRTQRRRVGLRTHNALLSLGGAYRIAGALRNAPPAITYAAWVRQFDSLDEEDRTCIRRDSRRMPQAPRFRVALRTTDAPEDDVEASAESVRRQLHRKRRLMRHEGPGMFPDAAKHPKDWWIVLPPGARLAEHALHRLAHVVLENPECELVYTDHDHIDDDGERVAPCFKPEFSPEHLRHANYIGWAFCAKGSLLAAVGPAVRGSHDFLLRASELIEHHRIRRLPAPLFHARLNSGRDFQTTDPEAVARHLDRIGRSAAVDATPRGHCRIVYEAPTPKPAVSIIIPTRDKCGILANAVNTVLGLTDGVQFEIIVVDNLSREPETLEWLEAMRRAGALRVIRHQRPFNYSAMNNLAVRRATGQAVCLLNNDVEVISPDWLAEMLRLLVQPGVGVVGAKLYYGDGRVQHAGDAVGPGGLADHMHSGLAGDEPGYCDRAVLPQEVSAVTGACLLTWKDLYLELGGLDEQRLPVAFNDVDYCLRVWEAGKRVLFTPHAELLHLESFSRGGDEAKAARQRQAKAEAAYMRRRWAHRLPDDPFYNPNLNQLRPDFALSLAPPDLKPWRR